MPSHFCIQVPFKKILLEQKLKKSFLVLQNKHHQLYLSVQHGLDFCMACPVPSATCNTKHAPMFITIKEGRIR